MIITKALESETPDENIQPKVCFNILIFIIMCVTYYNFTILAWGKSKILFVWSYVGNWGLEYCSSIN